MPSNLALGRQISSDTTPASESRDPSGDSQNVENVLIGMGLIDSHLTHAPSNDSAHRGPKSSTFLPTNMAQVLDADRRAWIRKSPSRHHFRARKHGGPPFSPSFPTYDSGAALEKASKSADSQFRNGSFSDNVFGGKRTRGLSNLFKPRSVTKTSGKGDRTCHTNTSARLTRFRFSSSWRCSPETRKCGAGSSGTGANYIPPLTANTKFTLGI